jgi:hypothetical protein
MIISLWTAPRDESPICVCLVCLVVGDGSCVWCRFLSFDFGTIIHPDYYSCKNIQYPIQLLRLCLLFDAPKQYSPLSNRKVVTLRVDFPPTANHHSAYLTIFTAITTVSNLTKEYEHR